MVKQDVPITHIINKRIKLRDQDIASNKDKVHLLNGDLVSRQYYNLMQATKLRFIPNAKMSPQALGRFSYNPGALPTGSEIDSFPEIQVNKGISKI